MTRSLSLVRLVVILGALSILSGCAMQHVAAPGSGRSRLEQIILSSTIDEAVNQMTQQGLDPLTGKKVYVRVGDLEADGLISDYVRTTLELRLTSLGVAPVEDAEKADALMLVRVRVAGVDRSGLTADPLRGLLSVMGFLFQYDKVWCAAELEAQAINQDSATILLPSRPTGMATNSWSQLSILPIIFSEPVRLKFESSSVESPLLD